MTSFAYEDPKHTSKRCRFFTSALKDAIFHCHSSFHGRPSSSSLEDQKYIANDINEEQEVIVLEICSRAMEAKLKRKGGCMTESLRWVFSPTTGEMFMAPKDMHDLDDNKDEDDEEIETFFSVESCFTRCSNASKEILLAASSCFSGCSSMSKIKLGDLRRHSMIQEFYHCEGWPFGLYRNIVLLPPLPTSPSESWSWQRGNRTMKMH
ncbi:PREDICTED: uncharacterized protein LOC104610593 [Nelumbo nucifera]|uniref:Uncharacterized protein n=2 Tax=Nelumbo nucifera TaxID=4432 RepID=A0A822XRN5_NELNU|nr:PREDICTED: uncharacterized protein LOC104610593 [Nelumbo nucifera]DAD22333.1 TPA_asm: hypothetical protein HUJ06_023796 [Nelumbo nucifera]